MKRCSRARSRPDDVVRAYENGGSSHGLFTPDCSNTLLAGRYDSDRLVVVLRLQNLAATVETVRADMVTQMRFAGGWLNSGCWSNQKIVRTMHAALGRGLFVLLNCHDDS